MFPSSQAVQLDLQIKIFHRLLLDRRMELFKIEKKEQSENIQMRNADEEEVM